MIEFASKEWSFKFPAGRYHHLPDDYLREYDHLIGKLGHYGLGRSKNVNTPQPCIQTVPPLCSEEFLESEFHNWGGGFEVWDILGNIQVRSAIPKPCQR
jgi:hypothetical protein